MKITVNGQTRPTEACTVADLLAEMGMSGKPVAVERNKHVVPRRDHKRTELAEGDVIELVTLVGGG
ncbi:MAG: sulfur carrier protein ThiS [Phycisphaeraceae bacterium]|nr:sulfur carrier protein ThiS [Phycisphaeraceae bacterium]